MGVGAHQSGLGRTLARRIVMDSAARRGMVGCSPSLAPAKNAPPPLVHPTTDAMKKFVPRLIPLRALACAFIAASLCGPASAAPRLERQRAQTSARESGLRNIPARGTNEGFGEVHSEHARAEGSEPFGVPAARAACVENALAG